MSELEEEAEGFVDENGNPRSPTLTDVLAVLKELERKLDYLTNVIEDRGGCRYDDGY